ncbi:tetratricopeptide (TPR) repeat protein/DNA replication protein DnaC [Pseudomonas sp. BS3782 TE3695]|uniref:tetratricopeptide repeat protein n=1 Tax=Pseudomonas sp. BS3782 TE3695 TaxID=3349323 RepID=UPI003D1ABD28
MKKTYQEEIVAIESMDSQIAQFTHLTSCLRSILQIAAISSLELIKSHAKTADEFQEFEHLAVRFQQPSDGLPVEVLDKAVPLIRSLICPEFLHGWYERSKSNETPFVKLIDSWVQFRNKIFHGAPDQNDISEWQPKMLSLLKLAVEIFSDAIPNYSEEKKELTLCSKYGNLTIRTPLQHDKKAIVITKVSAKKGVWKIQAKQLCWTRSLDVLLDIESSNVFREQDIERSSKFNYTTLFLNDSRHGILQNIPTRQTRTFEGRKKELDTLLEWINEPAESKSCQIYGDGGYGKTTLALEFLNNILDGHTQIISPPEIISYHTAKMTKWTDQGIVHCRGISSAMGESVRELMYCFQDVLGKEWYKVDGLELINKVQTELIAQGYTRDDVLLILDNTETLTSSTSDTEELNRFFEQVAKRIGRIIITSRRREDLGAKPIKVTQLAEAESLNLITRLAQEYDAKPIKQAGEPKLRKACAQLMHKPLLIDALVKYIARTPISIDEALNNVLRKTNDQLLEFLYEDAWQRMNEGQRNVFFILVLITCPADEFSVGYACQEVGIPHDEFINSLEETYFSNQSKRGNTYQIEMVDLARQFFRQQLGKLSTDALNSVKLHAESVDNFAREKEIIEREYKNDRISQAFKVQYAKAAKVAAEKGQIEDARGFYELAIQEDPLNSALHDRFAWFLLHKAHDIDSAFKISKQSIELDPKNPDALITLAIIHYRRHELVEGDGYIARAFTEGKSESLCFLRMGIGRYHSARITKDPKAGLSLIAQAVEYLKRAQRSLNPADSYSMKNANDIKRFLAMAQNLTYTFQSIKPTPLGSVIRVTNLGGFDPS